MRPLPLRTLSQLAWWKSGRCIDWTVHTPAWKPTPALTKEADRALVTAYSAWLGLSV
jgi:hypothetical protein